MIRNYLLTILRQTRKNKDFAFINTAGLAVGMASCLVIAQFIYFHYSFDQQIADHERIFQVQPLVQRGDAEPSKGNKLSNMLAREVATQVPEIEAEARFNLYDYANNSIEVKNEKGIISLEQKGISGANKGAFSVFELPVIAGTINDFDAPSKAVMMESTALRYFESPKDAIGSTFALNGNNGSADYELVAIIKDLPENTHLDFSVLLSLISFKTNGYIGTYDSWTAFDYITYYKLRSPDDQQAVIDALYELNDANASKELAEYGYKFDFGLIPIKDIHLYSEASGDFKPTLDYRIVYALTAIALFILVIAWINYLNLSLVKTLDRLKEVGIRKTLGSTNRQINGLFIAEALTLNIIAFVVALTMAQVLSPWLEMLTGVSFDIFKYRFVTVSLFAIVLIGSLLIGLYPAIMTRSVALTKVLIGGKQQKLGGLALRKVLVSIQFIVTFLLIGGTLIIYQQVVYMKNAELGFDRNHVMVVKAPPGDVDSNNRPDVAAFNSFKTSLLGNPGVKMVTNAGEVPGEYISWRTGIKLPTMRKDEQINTGLLSMGLGYLEFLGLEVLAGRALEQGDDPWSTGDVVINEKLAEELGFENPADAIGKNLEGFYAPITVRGVVNNHHHTSLHDDYDPIAYILSSWTEYYFIKFDISNDLSKSEQGARYQALISSVEDEWNAAFDYGFDYFFLDSYFNVQYREDDQFARIFTSFAGLAIFIACLGLFGLTSITLKQRTKEIGIRKVLGAGSGNLIMLLSKSYVIIIMISYLLSMPVVWHFANRWLENYTFRIEMGVLQLLVPLLFVLIVAGVTIISRLMKAAKVNPVDSLKYE